MKVEPNTSSSLGLGFEGVLLRVICTLLASKGAALNLNAERLKKRLVALWLVLLSIFYLINSIELFSVLEPLVSLNFNYSVEILLYCGFDGKITILSNDDDWLRESICLVYFWFVTH